MSRAALVLLSCSTLMGCILTRDPTYDAPRNTPPVVLEDPSTPMNRFLPPVYLTDDEDQDGGVGSQIDFVALVRDPDIDQELEGLVFKDHNPDAPTNFPIIDEIRIPSNGTTTRRVEFRVDRATLERGCRVIELHVSRGFTNVTNPVPLSDPEDPTAPVDLGRGIWFLRVLDNREDLLPLANCEAP